jgi:hypothetical protein
MTVDTEFGEVEQLETLQRINRDLQRQLRKAKSRSEELVEATFRGARDAMLTMGPIKPVVPPKKDTRKHGGEVALWDLGDWQGSKKTTSYNSTVMVERVMLFCAKAHKITEIQRSDHPVKECHIIFGGDMVEGLFNFAQQVFEVDQTIFGQYVTVSRLLVDVVLFALSIYDRVTVVPEWGNHGRIGSKRDAVPSSDNIDRMCYHLARTLLEGENRLTWEDCPEDIQRVEIGNYRALAIHGDEIGRNGFASPMTLVNWVVRQKSGAYRWPFRDVYSHHYHTHAEYALPDGDGSLFQTASTESDNRYAGVTMAASAVPSQRLHFIDPDAGRVTSQFKVWLA